LAITPELSKVVTKLTLPDPSKETAGASTSPVILKFLAFNNLVAVSALPIMAPSIVVA
jgi:hypothetical protein